MPATAISPAIDAAFKAYGNGLVGNAPMPLSPWWPNINARTESYFHRLDVANTTSTLTFFQGSYSDFVTNLPQPGYIPGDHAMWATGLAFTLQRAYNVAGTAQAGGEPFQTDTDPSLVAADMQALIDHGLVEMRIGTVTILRRFGLFHFPSGGGLSGFASSTNTTTTTVNHGIFATNGNPDQDNKHRFTPPQAIYPNDQIVVTVRWPFTRTLTASYVLQADLEGLVVSPR